MKRRFLFAITLTLFLGLTLVVSGLPVVKALSSPDNQEHEWSIVTVEWEGSIGYWTSIALDRNDNPHISYQNSTGGDLKYAKWNGTAWETENVDWEGNVGRYTSIALDSLNNTHISYYSDSGGDLKYAKWNGTGWKIETVDSEGNVGQYTSIALDSNDNPHISYYEWKNATGGYTNDLKYARWNSTGWKIETVDSEGDVGTWTSIALDRNDNPHISYTNVTSIPSMYAFLKYAKWNGTGWQIENVHPVYVDACTSIALDRHDNPHISSQGSSPSRLIYAKWTGSKWKIETVDSGGIAWYTSIALDRDDNPHISYQSYYQDRYVLKYAWFDGLNWKSETVDSEGSVGDFTSIALDSNDNPHISYFHWSNHTDSTTVPTHDLRYATVIPPTPVSDPYGTTFGGQCNDWVNSLAKVPDGYVLAGATRSFGEGNENCTLKNNDKGWLIKTDKYGNALWNKTYSSPYNYGDDSFSDVKNVSDGYILVGSTQKDFVGHWPDKDVWLIKTDKDGNEIWSKTYDSGDPFERGEGVTPTTDGGYAIIASANMMMWLIKTDGNGNELWNRTYGDPEIDFGNSIIQTSDEGYILVGTWLPDSPDKNSYLWVLKTNETGHAQWNVTHGDPAHEQNAFGESVDDTGDGYIVVGNWGSGGPAGGIMLKIAYNGTVEWDKTLSDYHFRAVKHHDDGNIAVGYTGDDLLVLETDENGNELWNRTYGEDGPFDTGTAVEIAHHNGYAIAGTTDSYGAGGRDACLLLLYSNGNPLKFNVYWEEETYHIHVISNSTVDNLEFNQPDARITFNVTGPPGTIGFCNVTIPKQLLSANATHPWTVVVDDVETTYIQTENATHTSLYFTYSHSTKTVEITGTDVIPEFPTWTSTLLILVVFTAATTIYKRKLRKK